MKYVCTTEEFLENYYSKVFPRSINELDFADEYALEYIRWEELLGFCEAHKAENAELYSLLAEMHLYGKGTEQNEEKAMSLLREGAEKGSPACMTALANKIIDRALLDFNYDEAFPLLEKAVSLGYLPACNTLGWLYVKGCGTQMDRKKALELYRAAAEGGLLSGKYNCAVTLARDDAEKALAYMEEAAGAGYEKAACWLGQYYLNGVYREPDYKKAHYWFFNAAWNDSAAAFRYLGEIYESGKLGEKNLKKAEFCYKQAILLGYSGTRRELARMYREMKEPQESSDDE